MAEALSMLYTWIVAVHLFAKPRVVLQMETLPCVMTCSLTMDFAEATEAKCSRPFDLDGDLTLVLRLASLAGDCSARDGRRLAPPTIQDVLDVEDSPR